VGALYGAADRTVDRAIRAIPGVGNYLADLQRVETDKTPEAGLRAAGGYVNREAGYTPFVQSTATDVSGGIGQLVGQGLTFAATGGTGSLALNLGLGADQGSDIAEAAGMEGTAGADIAVLASAPVAAALEKVGLDALLKRAPPGLKSAAARWVTDKLVAAGIEGTQEAAEQVIYNAIAKQAYNPEQELTAGVADSFEVGGWVGGVARILVGGRYARTRAEQEGELLDLLGNDAAASALRQRDPARFRELVAGLSNGGAGTVYLDAEQAMTYFQSAALDPASLGIDPEALSEAVALGGDVSVPMADWLTSIAPDHGQALGKFARLTPLGVDRAGLDAFDEQVDAAALRFLESVDESAGQATDTAVYQDVLGQLLGTGMQQPVAEQNAQLMQSVFRSLANRSGRDAMELYQQYGLRIVRDQPEALSVLRKAPEVDAVIDSLLDRLSAGDIPTEVQAMGSSLVEWLADSGGVQDPVMTGELDRLSESDRVNRRGLPRLVRPDATRTLDEAREIAAEAGYLPMDSTVNDLLDALTQEVDGGPAIRVGGDVQAANTRAAILELDELLGRAGIDPADRDAAKAFLMGGQEFDQALEVGTFTDEQRTRALDTSRFLDIGLKFPVKGKLYRGVSERSGSNSFTYGRGLYTTADKKMAKEWGKVVEMSREDLPNNPVRFDSINRWNEWQQFIAYDLLGMRRLSEFEQAMGSPEKWIRQLDPSIDGVQVGSGKDAFFVKFPPEQKDAQVFYQDALPEPDLVASLRARIAELEAELRRDKLTGMRNRTAFDEDSALGWPNTAMLDLDGLKAVNDDLGHAWGDVLLKKAGEVMLAAEREGVRFYRQGGDEYTARFAEGVDAEAVMREVRDRLASVDVEMDTPDGPRIYSGIGAGYGIGSTPQEADAAANADKERRVATGQRAPRGQARAADRLVRVARGGDRRARGEQAGEQAEAVDGLTEYNQSAQTETPEFRRWFGDSKVVDADGKPLVVYHGSPDARFMEDGATFMSMSDRYGDQQGVGVFWFAKDRGTAASYADDRRAFDYQNADAAVIPAYLKLENPLIVDGGGKPWREAQARGKTSDVIEQAKSEGHDGVIIRNVRDDYTGFGRGQEKRATDTYVVFDSRQIKSATANSGAFDPNNPSILAQDDAGAEAIRRGYIKFAGDRKFTIGLTENADLSTFAHESAHFFLEVMGDLARDPNAPAGIAEDYAAIVRWLGVESRDQIGVEQHEQFARGFEKWLGEGNAPTPELTGAFRRFKSWMKAIYKTLTALNVELTDEVRGVFDRLVAGDEAVARAEQAVDMQPLFREAAAAGMSEARFREYLRLQALGHEEAEARMAARAVREVQREHEAWWEEESAAVQREVEAELYAMPVYQAWSNMAKGTQPDGSPLPAGVDQVKLDKGILRQRYGQEFLNKNLLRKNVYAVDGGVDPDLVAPTYGFPNGDALVTALSNAVPLKQAVKAETQARMLERHGDMRMDPALPHKAMVAVHNSKAMKAIEADVAALEDLTGTPKLDARTVRAWARGKVAGTRVRDLTPSQYLRAERKHAKAAQTAAAKGDYAGALLASRQRYANAILYSEASKAQDAFERRSKWIRGQNKASTQKNLAKAGQDFRDGINSILASINVRQPTPDELARQKPVRTIVDDLFAAGDEVSVAESVIQRADTGGREAMRDLTVTDFTEAYEAIKSLKHVAGQQNKLLAAEGKKNRDEAIGEMVARAEQSLPDRIPEALSSRDLTTGQQAKERVRRFFGDVDRPENVIEALDGGESGPWHDYFWTSLGAAETAATEYRRKLGGQLKALRKSLPKGFMDSLAAEVELPTGDRVSRGTLLGIVLNTGNAQNLQRLRDGGIQRNGQPTILTDVQVAEMRALLTDQELTYVQGLWDAVNSLWPDIVTLQTEMTGIPPAKVEPQAFNVNGRDMRGGYWPLAYDHSKSEVGERQSDDDALRLMMGQGYSRATTPKGYTKQRAQEVKAPLQLDFGAVLSRHLDNVMTDLSYRKVVKDVTSLMRSPKIKDAIIGRLGKTAYDTLKGSVAYSVSPADLAAQSASSWRSFRSRIVSNAAVSALAIRPDIALGNYASAMIQAMDRTGVMALSRGWWEFNTRRTATTEKIVALSPFMAQRLGDIDYFYQREIGLTQDRKGYGNAYKRVMMSLHRMADHDVTRAAWWGRYKNELDGGATSTEAARLADVMVRQTQTASGRKDLSNLERDPAFQESRMFMGPMFVIMGRMRAAAQGRGATTSVGSRTASLMLQVFLAPSIFMLAAGRWPEDGDDDDEIGVGEWSWWAAKNTLLFPLQALPIIREAASSIEALVSNKPINPRAAPTAQAAAGLVKSSKAIYDNVEDYQDTGEMDWSDMTRDLVGVAAPFTGAPASQVRITSKSIDAVVDDPDKNAVEFARLAIYGPPRE
jgi:diguanylate cyclase (GGDEF)-like protein